jgi:RNA polymerase sigma-70 factor, ECF subfamily
VPDAAEARGLLALMLFHRSRFQTRVANDGVPIALESQNRSLWDHLMIQEAEQLLEINLVT